MWKLSLEEEAVSLTRTCTAIFQEPCVSRKSKETVAENLSDSPVQALPADHPEESQGVTGIGKENG